MGRKDAPWVACSGCGLTRPPEQLANGFCCDYPCHDPELAERRRLELQEAEMDAMVRIPMSLAV